MSPKDRVRAARVTFDDCPLCGAGVVFPLWSSWLTRRHLATLLSRRFEHPGEAPMKTLLIVKSVVEVFVGLSLLGAPSLVVSILVGPQLTEPAAIAIARVAGVALLAIGISCWLARKDSHGPAARGLIVGLLLYDVSVILILLAARFATGLVGVGLWPAVILHSVLAIWSFLCLRKPDPSAVAA